MTETTNVAQRIQMIERHEQGVSLTQIANEMQMISTPCANGGDATNVLTMTLQNLNSLSTQAICQREILR